MDTDQLFENSYMNLNWLKDAVEYGIDTFQRSVLFADTMRKQGNNYLQHIEEGLPPVLTFAYDIIIDGRELETPVSFALAKIIDKRSDVEERRTGKRKGGKDRRYTPVKRQKSADPTKRPIIIFDPRAGSGPGIGGAKQDSEIGIALTKGHPVYVILFYPEPVPGQTIEDVENTEVFFVKEVAKRHPEAEKPALIGNCQAGWAIALMSAQHPEISGPIVLNGSPLSYWAGADGKNPMRYKAGLTGGAWLNSLWSDLGNGKFDGANLVAGFEDLDPSNTYWKKPYALYAKIDTEEKRYLDFDRWWSGFYMMTEEEMDFIVSNLFVGNKLEQGALEFHEGRNINLQDLDDPIVLFSSDGDNITPPQQALNWILKVYGSVDEIKRQGKVIVYLLHENIGHLGIFVSSSIAKKEHDKIIGNIDFVNYFPPGLYEMIIDKWDVRPKSRKEFEEYNIRYEARTLDDIRALDDGVEDETDFLAVNIISTLNDKAYKAFARPFVKTLVNEQAAEMIRQLHPLRAQRYSVSDLNPAMIPIKSIAPVIKKNRMTSGRKNVFRKLEKDMSGIIADSLDTYRNYRDSCQEFYFKCIYGTPFVRAFFSHPLDEISAIKRQKAIDEREEEWRLAEDSYWRDRMDKGKPADGLIRIMVAAAIIDEKFDQNQIKAIIKIVRSHNLLKNFKDSELKKMVQDQSQIYYTDSEKALQTLSKLIKRKQDRIEAVQIAKEITMADFNFDQKEKELLDKVEKILKVS